MNTINTTLATNQYLNIKGTQQKEKSFEETKYSSIKNKFQSTKYRYGKGNF